MPRVRRAKYHSEFVPILPRSIHVVVFYKYCDISFRCSPFQMFVRFFFFRLWVVVKEYNTYTTLLVSRFNVIKTIRV